MMALRVIGIDPGPTPGLVLLELVDRPEGDARWVETVEVLQCTPNMLYELLEHVALVSGAPVLVQTERFVVGRKSMKSARAGAVTRDMVGAIASTVLGTDHRMVQRSAAAVKPWATDERLDRAGLLAATKGMTHARDAARHALFAAVHDGGLPDPLSRKATP